MTLRLQLRCDYGPGVGAGHVVRQMALADAWVADGGQATITTPMDVSPWIASAAASYGVDVGGVSGVPDVVVFDSYRVTAEDVRRAGADSLVVLTDDFAQLDHHDAPVLLDHNHGVDTRAYPDARSDATLLLGSEYTLVRREFHPRLERADGPLRVLLVLGGDPDREALTRLERTIARRMPEAEVLVADGSVTDMAGLMRRADLAISASGSTVYELARSGVPAVVCSIVENQRRISQSLHDSGIAVAAALADAADALATLARDDDRRASLAERGMRTIDGLGPERVVAALRAAS